jgi:hypothetical protein
MLYILTTFALALTQPTFTETPQLQEMTLQEMLDLDQENYEFENWCSWYECEVV